MSTRPALAAECVGPPPLNPGDDRTDYETLRAQLVAEFKPHGVIEQANLRDVAAVAEGEFTEVPAPEGAAAAAAVAA